MVYELDLYDLKKVTDAIFDHIINDLNIVKVVVEEERDFYWEVPSESLYLVGDSQPQLDIGRLSDDWVFLESILKDKDHAVALMFMHVAPLLRRVGQAVGQ